VEKTHRHCPGDTKAAQHCSRGFLCFFVISSWCVYLDTVVFRFIWIFLLCCKHVIMGE
jgi:hypothetical protein